LQERQHLQRFAQSHFVRENAAESVAPEKVQPGHTRLLVGAQDAFEFTQRRTFEAGVSAFAPRAFQPRGRRGHGPARLRAQGRGEKAGLFMADAVNAPVLFRRAILQRLLPFLDRARIEDRKLPAAEPGVALPGADQSLDIGRGESLAAFAGERHVQVEPLHAGGSDLEAGFDPLQVLRGAAFEPFLEGNVPFALPALKLAREKIQHGRLAAQFPAALRVRTGEARPHQPIPRTLFGGEIPDAVTGRRLRVGHPGRFTARTGGEDTLPVAAFQPRLQLGEAAGEVQTKARGQGIEREAFQREIRLDVSTRGQRGPVPLQEFRHLQARQSHRSAPGQQSRARGGERLQRVRVKHPPAVDHGHGRPRVREGQFDFAVGVQDGLHLGRPGLGEDRDGVGFPERHGRVTHQRGQHGREIARREAQHRGCLPRQRFDPIQDRAVLVRESERLRFGQSIQGRTSAAPPALEHQHDMAARDRFGQLGRQDDVKFGGFTHSRSAGAQETFFRRARGGRGRGEATLRGVRSGGRGLLRLEMLQAHRDRVRADRSPLARGPAGAEILEVGLALDHEPGAIRGDAFLHDAAEDGGRPLGAQHLAGLDEAARVLDRVPARVFREEAVGEFDGAHAGSRGCDDTA
jgi:hypothetical protein